MKISKVLSATAVLLVAVGTQANVVTLDMTSAGAAGSALAGDDAASLFTTNGVTFDGSFTGDGNPVGLAGANSFGVKTDVSNNAFIDTNETATFTLSFAAETGVVQLKSLVLKNFFSTAHLKLTVGSSVNTNFTYDVNNSEFTTIGESSNGVRKWTPTFPITLLSGDVVRVEYNPAYATPDFGVGIVSMSYDIGADTSTSTLLQHWGFNQDDGTQLTAVTNSVVSGVNWEADKANMTVSNNVLRAVKSSGGVYVNSLNVGNATNGQYELSWTFTDVDIADPDGTFVTYGAGLYNAAPGSFFDLAFTRIVWVTGSASLTIQAENGDTGGWDTIHNFGSSPLATNVAVRMVCDLDTDLYDVYLNDNGSGETQIGTDIPMKDGLLSRVRMGGGTQNLSASNFIDTDDIKLALLPLPPADTPTSLYQNWAEGYVLGSQTNLLDDPDGDLLDNLTEYAWGGDPDDPASQGNLPWSETASSGGTNYLQYIYYERTNSVDLGLSTLLDVGTDLVNTNWGVHTPELVGSGPSAIAGYTAVTNRIPTDTEVRQFIRQEIRFTP